MMRFSDPVIVSEGRYADKGSSPARSREECYENYIVMIVGAETGAPSARADRPGSSLRVTFKSEIRIVGDDVAVDVFHSFLR